MVADPCASALTRRFIIELGDSSEDIETFVPAFFEREAPELDDEERHRIMILGYEFAWHRAESLQNEAKRLWERAVEQRDLSPAVEMIRRRELSEAYFEVFKRLGAYLIAQKPPRELQRQRH